MIEGEGLVERVADVGGYLIENLRSLQEGCEPMSDVRGHGLFIGMEWVTDRESKQPDPAGASVIVNRLRQAGFLMGQAGEFGNVLKVRPPLVLQREQADMFLEAFEAAIAEPV